MGRSSTVTAAEVAAKAGEIAAKGQKPTARTVRDALGAGSYTTVQTLLAAWEEEQRQTAALPPPPAEVIDLAQRLWGVALRHAVEDTAAVRAEATAKIATATEAQREALAALQELEREHEQVVTQLVTVTTERDAMTTTAQAAQAAAERTATERDAARTDAMRLSGEVERLRADLVQAQAAAVEAARSAGEVAALRDQLAEQRAFVARLVGAQAQEADRRTEGETDPKRRRVTE